MNKLHLCLLTGTLGCAGAAGGGAPAVAAPAPVPVAPSTPPVGGPSTPVVPAAPPDVRAPVQVRIEAPTGVPKAGSTVALTWVVDMAGLFPVPMTLSVRVPKGVEVSGDVSATILPEPGVKRGRVLVRVREVPKEDLVVIVDGQTRAAGVHAEIPYRFGRPEPRVPEPRRADVPVTVGGVGMGRPVLMD